MLISLYQCNIEASIIPSSLFYNPAISRAVDLSDEWTKYKTSDNTKVFNFFSYPYLIPVESKYKIIRYEFERQMSSQVYCCLYIAQLVLT